MCMHASGLALEVTFCKQGSVIVNKSFCSREGLWHLISEYGHLIAFNIVTQHEN